MSTTWDGVGIYGRCSSGQARRGLQAISLVSGLSQPHTIGEYQECGLKKRGLIHSLNRSAGHYFEYDPTKLERLQDLTIELRLGQRRDVHEDVE
jgi:hypothetical protein